MWTVSLTQYYTATTLDGFIADADNSLDWLFTRNRDPDGPLSYGAFIADVGAMAMGSTTYEWILDHEFGGKDPHEWKWPYEIPCWVFTHRQLRVVSGAPIEFTSMDVATVHERMVEAAPGRNVWIVRRWRPGRSVRRSGAARRGPRVDRAAHSGCGCASASSPDRVAPRRARAKWRFCLRQVLRRALRLRRRGGGRADALGRASHLPRLGSVDSVA